MNPVLDLFGIAFGGMGGVLGLAVLITVHRDAPAIQRTCVGAASFLCFVVMINGGAALPSTTSIDFSPSPVAVGFAGVLAGNWGYRLRAYMTGHFSR